MESIQKTLKPYWFKLSRKTFSCPQCGQRLRVPIRPGKTLRVNCVRCPSAVLLDFRIPFIEVFRWQSGKSLKQNLVDMHHRFWNMPVASKIQILLWLFILAIALDVLIQGLFSLTSSFSLFGEQAAPLSSPVEENIRTI